MQLFLYHFEKEVKTLGPGKRFVIWTQGCDKRCKNCIAPDTWSKTSGGFYISIEDLSEKILTTTDLRGVTISGGEPFLQSEALFELVTYLKKVRKELDYIVYSGYTYEEILKKKSFRKFLEVVDVLIDGEYVDALNYDTPLIGSTNQKVYYFTERGEKIVEQMAKLKSREVEIIINSNNEIFIAGVPSKIINIKLGEIL